LRNALPARVVEALLVQMAEDAPADSEALDPKSSAPSSKRTRG